MQKTVIWKENLFEVNVAKFRSKTYLKEKARRCASDPTAFSSIVEKVFDEKGNSDVRVKLFHLYEHWDMVLGEDLYTLALPIGHRGKILLVAAEDSIALNELTYMIDEILERVHAFFGEEYFEKVELHLLQNKRPLNLPPLLSEKPQKTELIRPENLGNLNLPDGKVKDAYLHYLSLFE